MNASGVSFTVLLADNREENAKKAVLQLSIINTNFLQCLNDIGLDIHDKTYGEVFSTQ